MNLNNTHHLFESTSIFDEHTVNSFKNKNFSFDENDQTNDI